MCGMRIGSLVYSALVLYGLYQRVEEFVQRRVILLYPQDNLSQCSIITFQLGVEMKILTIFCCKMDTNRMKIMNSSLLKMFFIN